jgi:hypothetical protein
VDEQTVLPAAGMTISIRTRRDVVIMDPERFMASARAAYRDLYPEAGEDDAAEYVRDVYDAVDILLERFGRLAPDTPGFSSATTCGPVPGHRALDRPDGLSPAGEIQQIVLEDPKPLQDYGPLFLPEDPFALPPGAVNR